MSNKYYKNLIFVKCLLAAFLLLSGLSTLARAQQSADSSHAFESEIVAFEKADAQNSPPRHAVLFVGSSSIRKWTTLKHDFPNKQIIKRGFGGSQFSDLLYYADRIVFPYHPRQIFVYEGDNDIAAGVSPQVIFKRFKTFVQRVKKRLPGTKIDFISIKPSPSRKNLMDKMKKANRMIKKYMQQTRELQYVNVFDAMLDKNGKVREDIFTSDNLHMNAKGYDIWQRIIRPYLQ